MDEIKRIIREIADTKVEIRVCERLKDKGVVTRGSKSVSDLLAICERKLITLDEQLTILKKPAAAAPSAAAPRASQEKKPTKATAPSASAKKPAAAAAPAAPDATKATKAKAAKKSPPVVAVPQPVEAPKVAAVVATIAPQPLHQKRPALVVTTPPINQKRPVLVVTNNARTAAVGARALAQANNLKKPALVSAALVPPRPVRR
jgi:hypothetical protein